MSKFKVGDRVAVYGVGAQSRRTGTVESFCLNDDLAVKLDDSGYAYFHPKQCRRLKKVAKAPKYYWGCANPNDTSLILAVGDDEYETRKELQSMRNFTKLVKLKVVK